MAEEQRPKTAGLEPIMLSMMVCDQIYTDPQTRKRSLLGCFNSLRSREFPATVPFMALFLAFTNARGKIPLKVKLVDAEEANEPIMEMEAEIESADPRAVCEIALQVGQLIFPAAGEYRFQVYAYGTLLMERRIMLLSPPEKRND